MDRATRRCLGIMGRQITEDRECQQGEDWHLLHLTLIDFTSGRCAPVAAGGRLQIL